MAQIKSIITGRVIELPDEPDTPSASDDVLKQALRLAKIMTAEAAREVQLLQAAREDAIAERDRALAERQSLVNEASTARAAAATAQSEAATERALRMAAEQTATADRARYEQDRAAWLSEEKAEGTATPVASSPPVDMAVIASVVAGAVRDQMSAVSAPNGNYDVVITERDGNGDGKRFIIKKK